MIKQTRIGLDGHYLAVQTIYDSGDRTTMRIRRIKTDHIDEHVQIEIDTLKRGNKRDTISHGYLELKPGDVQAVIAALSTLVPPTVGYVPPHEVERETAKRLGLDNPERIYP